MKLEEVYPWGHTLADYRKIFQLVDEDLSKRLISFADGTASVNSELGEFGHTMVSVDPIYQFSTTDIDLRLNAVLSQSEQYQRRLSSDERQHAIKIADTSAKATRAFLADFDLGREQQRYLAAALPDALPFDDNAFDIGLCAHFLLLYDHYGVDFHVASITEMLRICGEIRIYPTINLHGQKSLVLDDIINYFSDTYPIELVPMDYGFQNMGNEMLKLSK
jgi:hypothetical protein